MASNQRQIVITQDPSETIESMTISWPGGLTRTLIPSEITPFMPVVEQRAAAAVP